MTDYGKILNTEALDRIKLSEKLPPFRKQRRGTEIFIFDNRIMVSVYDDYSMYPEAEASKWRVKVYSRRTGDYFDKICIRNGLYPTRERAFEEIERFRERAEDLIFYLVPIKFTCNIKELIWPEEEVRNEVGIATDEELQEEAKKRLFLITGRKHTKNIDLRKEYKGCAGETALNALYETFDWLKTPFFPYAFISMGTILCISHDKSEWEAERECMNVNYHEYGDGCTIGYAYDFFNPEYSEYGDVFYKYESFCLYRSA